VGLRVIGRGTGVVFAAMKRATGIDLLEDLSEFFRSFGDMAEGFRERAERVNALLADSRTAFVLVTSPQRDAVDEAVFFHHRLLDSGLPFAGAIVNRVHELPEHGRDGVGGELEQLLGERLAQKVARNLEDYERLADRDGENLELLAGKLGRKPMLRIPHLDDDVHDLDGLARMNEHLFR
jgi:anion-transporting  ArsA/GET3 family ATPase